MATVTAPRTATTAGSTGLDWTAAALAALLVGGACLDAWAHWHVPNLETFFTPWHFILYSGMFVNIVLVAVLGYRGRAAGPRGWFPPGYGLTAVGCLTFLVAGQGDMLWHIYFGIEQNTAALLSPTHLGLMVGAGLIAAGPWRAARLRGSAGGYPSAVSAGLVLTMMWFFLQFNLPYTARWASTAMKGPEHGVTVGVGGILILTVTLVGVVLVYLRDLTPPPGLVTVATMVPTLLLVGLSGQSEPLVTDLAALVAAVAADVVLATAPRRLFAVVLPVFVSGAYFAGVALTGGVWWSVHVWAGCVIVSGVIGWLLGEAVTPRPARD